MYTYFFCYKDVLCIDIYFSLKGLNSFSNYDKKVPTLFQEQRMKTISSENRP